ncbi:MAG: hypothetical protein CFH41_02826 [Alphaproteobacteria bacterium MarineAlpha11_Bin1]|nr:MAG: hypothetical protein CFH41_02826 [Alphaproteobacteria bacterium MarineAlpha11_Bin1]
MDHIIVTLNSGLAILIIQFKLILNLLETSSLATNQVK